MFRHIFSSGHFHERHGAGRRGGHRGPGHFAGGGFSGDDDGEGFRSGRKLASADLQLVLLALLAERASHGYELIKALEEKSAGFYTPSPGMVYPALTYLEEIGHATVVAEGTKKRYEITSEGLAHFHANEETARSLLQQIERVGAKMRKVREFFSAEGSDDRGHGALHEARHKLRAALHSRAARTPEEEARIAAILQRAADEIAGGRK